MATVVMTVPTLVMLLALMASCKAGGVDVSIVYRFHMEPPLGGTSTDSTNASVEYRARTNSLGMSYFNYTGEFSELNTGHPSLGCTSAASQCSWTNNGLAITTADMSAVLPSLVLNWNGGMPICPAGYILEGTMCKMASDCSYIVFSTTGKFDSPGYPSTYPTSNCSWLLITPVGHKVQLTLNTFKLYGNNDYLTVYDGASSSSLQLGRYNGGIIPVVKPSSGNVMLVTFVGTYSSSYNQNFRAGFSSTELKRQSTLAVSGASGYLTSPPVQITDDAVCVSVSYRLASYSSDSITVSALLQDGTEVILSPVKLKQVKDWRLGRFTAALPSAGESVTFSVAATGTGSSIFSILGCDPHDEEDTFLIAESVPSTEIPKPQSTTPSGNCYNGAIWDSTNSICICPVGYTGPTCEEGCGPNRYGEDCAGVCTDLARGCKGMIFCKQDLPCTCAPGFYGDNCEKGCSGGMYGTGCQNSCGSCNSGRGCDRYTGKCDDLCRAGFYPPLCQEKYKALNKPPRATFVSNDLVALYAQLSDTIGRGTPRFFVVEYKEDSDYTWIEKQPQLITTAMITDTVRDLRAGVEYNIRISLIDVDGNSNTDNLQVLNVETSCKVPVSTNFTLQCDDLSSSSFRVTWEYSQDDTFDCPVTAFDVYLLVGGIEVHHRPTSQTVTYQGLLPNEDYEVKVRAVTKMGVGPFSSPLLVTTDDGAPSEVVNLKVSQGSVGELEVSWEPPRSIPETIQFYRIEYSWSKLLGCQYWSNNSPVVLETNSTSALLEGLLSHAQYSVKVAGVTTAVGKAQTIDAVTIYSAPTVAPDAVDSPVSNVTSVGFTVNWNEPSNCTGLNGYFQQYRFDVTTESAGSVQTGTSDGTSAQISGLTPGTVYQVLVYVVTTAGWSPDVFLNVTATTLDAAE